MKAPVDMFGRDIKSGDLIIYGVKNSTQIEMHVAVVDFVVDNGEDTYLPDRYELFVRSYADKHKYEFNLHCYVPGVYKTTLKSNATIVKITINSIPLNIARMLETE